MIADFFQQLLEAVALGFVYDAFLTICIHFRIQYKCIVRTMILAVLFMMAAICIIILFGPVVTTISFIILGWIMEETATVWLSEWKFNSVSAGSSCGVTTWGLHIACLCVAAFMFIRLALWIHIWWFFAVPVIVMLTEACGEFWVPQATASTSR